LPFGGTRAHRGRDKLNAMVGTSVRSPVPPRRSRKRKLLWLTAILTPILSCGGINAWHQHG
jgi:hypothetical protein